MFVPYCVTVFRSCYDFFRMCTKVFGLLSVNIFASLKYKNHEYVTTGMWTDIMLSATLNSSSG